MKIAVITKAAVLVDQAAAKVESVLRGGHARVVSMLCRGCGQWVNPADWNPTTAACDGCTARELRAARTAARFRPPADRLAVRGGAR